MHKVINFTKKQINILKVIKRLTKYEHSACTIYDIIKHVDYKVKRDAMLHSIKILVEAGMVERLGLINDKRMFGVTNKVDDYIG